MAGRALLLLLLLLPPAMALGREAAAESAPEESVTVPQILELPTGELPYRAIAGHLPIGEDPARPEARMFLVAYDRLDATDPGWRPHGLPACRQPAALHRGSRRVRAGLTR